MVQVWLCSLIANASSYISLSGEGDAITPPPVIIGGQGVVTRFRYTYNTLVWGGVKLLRLKIDIFARIHISAPPAIALVGSE